jgi:hypothetical protein
MSDEQQQKQYKTEWSFSFEKLGDQIADFFKSLGSPDEVVVKTETFSEVVGGAQSARVRLDLSAGETNVYMLNDSDKLLDAEITYIGEMKFAVGGDVEKVVSLSQSASPGEWFRHALSWLGSRKENNLRWQVGLTPNIPLELDVHGGVGECNFSLAALKPGRVALNGGTGEISVTLPSSPDLYTATVNGGVGELNVMIPAGATVNLSVRAGTGAINLDIGVGAAADISVNGGVGEVDIRVPADAGVRIEGKAGIGDINVPSNYARLSGSDEFMGKSGVWQSSTYGAAERRINVKYNGGVGALVVK